MRQATLKIKTYAGNVNVVGGNLERTILRGMLIFMAGLAVLYVVFLGTMVFNIVERKALETQTRTLTNEVNDLELTYLSTSNKIDIELSHALGFKAITPSFTTRQAVGLVSKSNNNEI